MADDFMQREWRRTRTYYSIGEILREQQRVTGYRNRGFARARPLSHDKTEE